MVRAKRGGERALRRRADGRLRSLVDYARAHSPLLSDLYSHLPRTGWELADLPATSKRALMAEFDDWLTDLTLTRAQVAEFVADPANVAQPLGPAALVCTSSGTTGVPGLFVHDPLAAELYWSNPIVRGYGTWFGPRSFARFMRHGGREAQIIGTGTHFGGATWALRALRRNETTLKALTVVPAQLPISEIVDRLNAFDPAVLAGYSTSIQQLAAERRAGRLRVAPALVATSGEGITEVAAAVVATAFGCMVRQSYAASETLFMAHSCAHGWLHLSSDWYLLEPVQRDGSPTPAGVASHSVLVTNLANRLQPIIRYDLGDSVLMRPDLCECGSPLPAFRVTGRTGELLTFHNEAGRAVTISPMVLGTALDEVAGATRSQVVQESQTAVSIRFEVPGSGIDAPGRVAVGEQLRREVAARFAAAGLANVGIRIGGAPPAAATPGAKFRRVVAR